MELATREPIVASPNLGVVQHSFPGVQLRRELQKRNNGSRSEYIDISFKRVFDSPEKGNHHPNCGEAGDSHRYEFGYPF
jgi:hypothetical protein